MTTTESKLKKDIEDTCYRINQVELAGMEDNESQKFYRRLQKRKMYLKAKLKGYQEACLDEREKIKSLIKNHQGFVCVKDVGFDCLYCNVSKILLEKLGVKNDILPHPKG